MAHSRLAGNPRIRELLSQPGELLSHAYLLAGPEGSGRHTLARLLAAAMLCRQPGETGFCGRCTHCKKVFGGIHPDVIAIHGPAEGKPISVDQVRDLRSDAYIRPNEGQRKIYILEQAQTMNASAQNAMLKLLEEGPSYAAFLLLTDQAGSMLQTIRSRCEQLSLLPVPPAECEQWLIERYPDKNREVIHAAALDCQGILGRAVEQLEGGDEVRTACLEQARGLCDALERGSEGELFETVLPLDKLGREELEPLFRAMEVELVRRIPGSPVAKRLLRAVELVRQLREAAALNVNAGQLFGWLCAGLYV